MAVDPDRWMAQGLPKAWARELFDNFGGYVAVNVSNGHTVTVPDEVRYVYHYLTGTVTGTQTYTFPVIGGYFFLYGAYNGTGLLNVKVLGGTGIYLTPGKITLVFIDQINLTLTQITTGEGSNTTSNANATTTYQIPDTGIGLVRCDASGGGFSVFLPLIANTRLRTFIISRIAADGTNNTINVYMNVTDGPTKIIPFSLPGSVTIYNNGAGWDVL